MLAVLLTVVSGPRLGVKLRLRDKTAVTIGRSKTTDFHVLDGTLSRVHAVIAFDGKEWYVEDQKSRNGTWIDGQQVTRATIRDGDVILLGRDTAVRFEIEADADSDDGRSSTFGVIPPCATCGGEIGGIADLVRAPDGKPFHIACRNLDHLVGAELGEFKIAESLPKLGEAFFFRAHQASLNRSVMLEVFDPPLTSIHGYRQALLDEVRRASRFLHPNILQIFSFEEARGNAFVVMEYFRGERLSTVLEQRRFVRIRGAVQVASSLVEALSYARDHGGLRAWITTEPILVSGEHSVKVKLFEDPDLHRTRTIPAKEAPYYAPEVLGPLLGGHEPDPDDPMDVTGGGDDPALVYSIGAILYHMLAGIPPFEGQDASEVLRRAQSESPPALRRINMKVSPPLAQVVERAISRRRDDRYPTFEELHAALHAVL